MLKRSFGYGDDAVAFGDERGEHSKTIVCVVVQVLGGEAERGELVHCPAVIVVAAEAAKQKAKREIDSSTAIAEPTR